MNRKRHESKEQKKKKRKKYRKFFDSKDFFLSRMMERKNRIKGN